MIVKSTRKGFIESPDGDVTVVFKKNKSRDERIAEANFSAIEDLQSRYLAKADYVLSQVESIEGLFDEDGNAITAEDIRSGNTYEDILAAMIVCYYKTKTAGADAKKAPASTESESVTAG